MSVPRNYRALIRQPECILPASFFEGRFAPDFEEGSSDEEQWWEDQIERCRLGWKDGGFSVDGVYYYHLNFKKINTLDEVGRPIIDYAFYSEEDQQIFHDLRLCRTLGKAYMLITGRGFGKSFDVSSVVEHEFTFYDATECIVSSSVDLYASETWSKIEMGLNSQPAELRLNLLKDDPDLKIAGNKVKVDGKMKKVGSMSKIRKVVYDDDSGRTRGTRPNIHIFEEVGAWSGAAQLIDCYQITEASWWRGSKFTCLPILIGTGGQMMSGASKDAKRMGLNPNEFNIMSFDYKSQKVCKFYPAYKKYLGFYEKSGKTDEIGAKIDLDRRREEKKDNIESFRQFTQEQPYDIYEAFEESGTSNFDKLKLENQYNLILRTPSYMDQIIRFTLKPVYAGGKIIDVERIVDKRGEFEMLASEEPRRDPTGNVVENLYISGCDSFDAAEEDVRPELSPGCIRIFKRFWKADETGRLFVAGLTIRTRNGSEFYEKTFLLNMYFRSKMLYEHTNKGIASWYIANGVHKYLYPRPSLDRIVKNPTSTNTYGIQMPIQVKSHAIGLYKEYIDNYSGQMWFPNQIKDAIDYRWGSKEHHETMASSIALLADMDMANVKIREIQKSTVHFPRFQTDAYGNRSFS